jgi:hypothetical protein
MARGRSVRHHETVAISVYGELGTAPGAIEYPPTTQSGQNPGKRSKRHANRAAAQLPPTHSVIRSPPSGTHVQSKIVLCLSVERTVRG